MTQTRRLVLVGVALFASTCMPPGGGVSGNVLTDSGSPVSGARVEVDFGGGAAADTRTEETGHFWTVWSHGSWSGIVVRASAAGHQTAEATAEWDSSVCEFRLASANAVPRTSRATCHEATE